MTAPERRRPLPALVFIGALSLLTALVWFRVLHRTDDSGKSAAPSCPHVSASATPAPKVLPVASQVSVIVLNSTNRNGIARAATKALGKAGFKVGKATDDSALYGGHGLIKGVAEIRYPTGQLAGATLLGYYLPGATLKANDSSGSLVVVSLGSRFGHVASAAGVKRALATAHATQRSSTAASPSPTPTSSTSSSGAC
jgi:hypothetical protein